MRFRANTPSPVSTVPDQDGWTARRLLESIGLWEPVE
jgi:hypothetical protein